MTKTRKPKLQGTGKVDKRNSTFEGLPIVDAAKNISLAITKRDATESHKKDPSSCAVALAGRRELHTDVRVYLTRTYVKDKAKKRWIRFMTPNAVSREIIAFDKGGAFEPGEYELKAPPKYKQLGVKRNYGAKTGKDVSTRPYHTTANVRVKA